MIKQIRWVIVSLVTAAILFGSVAVAEEVGQGAAARDQGSAYRTVGLAAAAAAAVALGILGAAYAVARIGSAALGAAAEKPELLTRSLVFVALAEGLAVLGFAIAMMLVQKI